MRNNGLWEFSQVRQGAGIYSLNEDADKKLSNESILLKDQCLIFVPIK